MDSPQIERIVLASLIYAGTNAAAKRVLDAAPFDLGAMLEDYDCQNAYRVYLESGPSAFGGKLGGVALEELATEDVDELVGCLVSSCRKRIAKTDRTLYQFESPGPDSEDPDCLFQNRWLRRGMCGAIVSTSGVGKSSFSMQAATLWAAGEECLGIRPIRPLKIGIFQSEDDEYDIANFRDRIRQGLIAENEWTPERIKAAESQVTFCALDGSTGDAFIDFLRRKQELHRFDLIIINPLFAFFGGEMNDSTAMSAFLRHGIDPLIKDEATKCGCLIIHHTAKPTKDRLEIGEQFAAYMGNGSSEFTNYIRSAIVISTKKGYGYGVFDFVAAKHGDKLGWRNSDGRPTLAKTVCYASILPEYADSGMIYWIEPDDAQLSELKEEAAADKKQDDISPREKARDAIVYMIKTEWTPNKRPENATKGQADWAERLPKSITGGNRSTNKYVFNNLIKPHAAALGLREVTIGKSSYLVDARRYP